MPSDGDCENVQWHLASICANLFGRRNNSIIFMKSDCDQKTVLSLQSSSESAHEYLKTVYSVILENSADIQKHLHQSKSTS